MSSRSKSAIDRIFSGSRISTSKPDFAILLKQQLDVTLDVYGPIVGTELVHEEEITPSLRKETYLLKQELFATYWTFTFYKPRDKWTFAYINFDDKIHEITK